MICNLRCECFSLSANVGSGASSSSESDVTCLQNGICAKQKTVSSRDAYIAKESLELLVTCLQLRTPLLGESPVFLTCSKYSIYILFSPNCVFVFGYIVQTYHTIL